MDDNLPPEYYTWTFPGGPVRVRIQLEVIRSLQSALAPVKDRADAMRVVRRGILLGRIGETNATEITAALPSPGDEPNAIVVALEELRKSSEMVPVGFYRTLTEEGFRFSDQDFEIARENFSNPGSVFLVIHLGNHGADRATFFFWDDSGMHRDFAFLEFPFDASLLASWENLRRGGHTRQAAQLSVSGPANVATWEHVASENVPAWKSVAVPPRAAAPKYGAADASTAAAANEPSPAGVPGPASEPAPASAAAPPNVTARDSVPGPASVTAPASEGARTNVTVPPQAGGAPMLQPWRSAVRRQWKLVVLLGVVALALLAGGVRVPRPSLAPSKSATTSPAAIAPAEPSAGPENQHLGLAFHHQGSDLVLTWDRDAAKRFGAEAGLLSIRDGGREKAIVLNGEQLRSANILLSPESDQVQIQLSLLTLDQRTISESGVAILSTRGPGNHAVQSAGVSTSPVSPKAAASKPLASKPVPSREVVERNPISVPTRSFTASADRTAAVRPSVAEPPIASVTGFRAKPDSVISSLGQSLPNLPRPAQNQPVVVAPTSPSPVPAPPPITTPPAGHAPPAIAPAGNATAETSVTPAAFVSGKNPAYPLGAHQARVQGTVVIDAQVGTDGKVKQTTVVSGNPMLRDAAVKAVRGWIFKPALINGRPVEGPARVEVKFHGDW